MEKPMNKWMIWGVLTHYFWKHPYTLRIHVWYIYLHLVDFYGKCWDLYHTWILWDRNTQPQQRQRQREPQHRGPRFGGKFAPRTIP